MKIVEASGFQYIVTVGDVPGVEMLVEMAYDLGLTGPGFQWITAAFPTEAKEIDAARSNQTSAFNGLLVVEIEVPQNPQFFGSLMGSLRDPEFTSFLLTLIQSPSFGTTMHSTKLPQFLIATRIRITTQSWQLECQPVRQIPGSLQGWNSMNN